MDEDARRTACAALKARVKELAARGRELRMGARVCAGDERWDKHNDARHVGRKARATLLAYAWIRGRSYALMEGPATNLPGVRVALYGAAVELDALALGLDRKALYEALKRWHEHEAKDDATEALPGGVAVAEPGAEGCAGDTRGAEARG